MGIEIDGKRYKEIIRCDEALTLEMLMDTLKAIVDQNELNIYWCIIMTYYQLKKKSHKSLPVDSDRSRKYRHHKGGGMLEESEISAKLNELLTKPQLRSRLKNGMIKFYQLKVQKYEKLRERQMSSVDAELKLIVSSQNEILQGVSTNLHQTGQNATSNEQSYQSYRAQLIQNTNNDLLLLYSKQKDLSRIQNIKKNVEDRILQFQRANDSDMKRFVQKFKETYDSLDTDNLTKLKCEVAEYLLKISKESVRIEGAFSPFNTLIVGNAGVGKSYAAEKVASLLKDSYLLLDGSVKNIKKPDVIGQHIGQTAPKIYNKLTESLECVCFIDEAYSIPGAKRKDTNQFDPFGQEAMDALTDFTSEHTGLISVIAAGYESEMKQQFLECNSGLPRRFPNVVRLERSSYSDALKIVGSSKTNFEFKFEFQFALGVLMSLFDYSGKLRTLDVLQTMKNRQGINEQKLNIDKIYIEIVIEDNQTDKDVTLTYFDRSLLGKFMCCYILEQSTGLKNGDLFNAQAADFSDYWEKITSFYEFTSEKFYDGLTTHTDRVYKYVLEIILKILKHKGITATVREDKYKAPEYAGKKTYKIVILDKNRFLQETNGDSKTMHQRALKSIIDISELETDNQHRKYSLFSLPEMRMIRADLDKYIKGINKNTPPDSPSVHGVTPPDSPSVHGVTPPGSPSADPLPTFSQDAFVKDDDPDI